jgi:hypothetical protein
MDKMKHAEFVVTAESPIGIERAVAWAMKQIMENHLFGEHTISKLKATVKWSIVDVTVPTEVESILPKAPEPILPVFQDISMMDIEDAKGIVGTCGTTDELDALEKIEAAGERTPGGRKGVLTYIEKLRKEIIKRELAKEEPAEKGSPEFTTEK